MYAVVEFLEEDTVEAVPQTWLNDNMCYWPPISTKSSEIKKMIKGAKVPGLNWRMFNVTIVKENIGKILFCLISFCVLIKHY